MDDHRDDVVHVHHAVAVGIAVALALVGHEVAVRIAAGPVGDVAEVADAVAVAVDDRLVLALVGQPRAVAVAAGARGEVVRVVDAVAVAVDQRGLGPGHRVGEPLAAVGVAADQADLARGKRAVDRGELGDEHPAVDRGALRVARGDEHDAVVGEERAALVERGVVDADRLDEVVVLAAEADRQPRVVAEVGEVGHRIAGDRRRDVVPEEVLVEAGRARELERVVEVAEDPGDRGHRVQQIRVEAVADRGRGDRGVEDAILDQDDLGREAREVEHLAGVEDLVVVGVGHAAVGDLALVRHAVAVAVRGPVRDLADVGQGVAVAVGLAGVRHQVAVAVGGPVDQHLTGVEPAVAVAVAVDPLLDLAAVGEAVLVAVQREPDLDLVVVGKTVPVAVELAVGLEDVAALVDPGAHDLVESRTAEGVVHQDWNATCIRREDRITASGIPKEPTVDHKALGVLRVDRTARVSFEGAIPDLDECLISVVVIETYATTV